MSEWISVKDRLPEDDRPILIYTKNASVGGYGKISICNRGKSTFSGNFASFEMQQMAQFQQITNIVNNLQNITHWMPLPEPPKEV